MITTRYYDLPHLFGDLNDAFSAGWKPDDLCEVDGCWLQRRSQLHCVRHGDEAGS